MFNEKKTRVNKMSNICCKVTDYDYVTCPDLCTTVTVNTSDAISLSIQAILNLGEASGSTAADIYNNIVNVIDPSTTFTITDIESALSTGTRRGIFFRNIAVLGATPTYMVNANMSLFNVANRKYNRFPCQQDSFYRPVAS